MKAAIRRNLSFAWYRTVPELEVEIEASEITTKFSQSDIALINHILFYNLELARQMFPRSPASIQQQQASKPESNKDKDKEMNSTETMKEYLLINAIEIFSFIFCYFDIIFQ